LLAGNSPDFALINPDMIFSSFHLLLAASIALLHANQGTMRVKTLHAELLYSLSPTTSISEAFRIFGGGGGAAPTKTDRLLFAFIDTPVPVIITQVFPLVQGRAVPAERVLSCLDARPMPVERAAAFREVFKVVGGGEKGQERKGDKMSIIHK
jgi:EKC/KEOPS complex subunit CGI121/TPRKB